MVSWQIISARFKLEPRYNFLLLIFCCQINLGVTTAEITNLAAETCAYMAIVHPDYTMLANRITVSALHDRTFSDIKDVAESLYNYTDVAGRPAGLLSEEVYNVFIENADKINAKIDYNRDFNYDFFGFKTLERAYLLR